MAILIFLGLLLFLLIAPRFLAHSREGRVRMAGMIFGCYLVVFGIAAGILIIYGSYDSGATWLLSRRRPALEVSFANNPILATLALISAATFVAGLISIGRYIFKASRRGTLRP